MKRQVISVLATGAVLLHAALPVFADTTLVITGNGADSNNATKLDLTQTRTVVQSNNADVKNDVTAKADSGGNQANKNTGGDVSITSGDASTDVKVQNSLNSNSAKLDCCGAGDTTVLIKDNGADSNNKAKLDVTDTTVVGQTNNAKVNNDINAKAYTGDNKADKNTGGDVGIQTGDASSKVDVSTSANANSAQVGGGNGGSGSLDLLIAGNGADSRNKIKLDLNHDTELVQSNNADVKNEVDAKAKTGDNKANENTGGDVMIDTGDAKVDVGVDNMVNFNWADVDCGCLFDLFAKLGDNGADTHNKISADLADTLGVYQDNCGDQPSGTSIFDQIKYEKCRVKNDVNGKADTGSNKAKENTGSQSGGVDPSVSTGDSSSTVDVSNAGNSNAYGAMPSDWPHLGGFNLNVTLDLSQLMQLLGLH